MAYSRSIYKRCLLSLCIASGLIKPTIASAELEEILNTSVRYEGSSVLSQHENVQQVGDLLDKKTSHKFEGQ